MCQLEMEKLQLTSNEVACVHEQVYSPSPRNSPSVASTTFSQQIEGVVRHHLLLLTKCAVNGTYIQVLPIDGIFAER